MTYLNECKQEYQRSFPLDWIENSTVPLKSDLSLINKFREKVFVLLSKSVLSGEYIRNTEKIQQTIESILELITHESDPKASTSPKKEVYKKYDKLDKDFRICLIYYKSLYSLVNDKINMASQDYIFNVFSTEDQLSGEEPLNGFVEYVIPLCKADHMLSYAKKSITDLILLREQLNKEKDKNTATTNIGYIYQVLYDKASFLLRKMLHLSGKSEYCLDFQKYSIEANDIKIESFKEFNKDFDFLHSCKGDKSRDVEPNILDLQLKCTNRRASLSERIMLMKYYQKDNGTVTQIDRLIEEFDDYYNKSLSRRETTKFNLFSLRTIKNYLYNCRLSYKIQETKYTYNALAKDMEEIIELQRTTLINNFYPYRKAIEFLIKSISLDLEKPLSNELEEILNQKRTSLNDYTLKLEKAIKWCKNINFYPFQLPFNECSIQYTELGTTIFTPSSFTKPIEYNPLFEELAKFKEKALSFDNKIDVLREKREIRKIKSEISRSERKYIEILGIFTAIITFLFATINFHLANTGFQNLVKSSLSLGIILLLFSCSIYFLTVPRMNKPKDYFSHPRFIFFLVSSIIYAAILCFIAIDYFL